MVKPRMIIVIRHAQSEGNENRAIHQTVPDHRVKLTPHGWTQASEAGRRLRSLLKPEDTLHFFTSPYRRTRETTEGILRTLTSDEHEEGGPSPFPRDSIKVWEEPRLREQDFGNFQPCSAQMERMWHERADYGHFFYRIPNGESAADAYDRISGFNETLWRCFGEDDFASVCVLVTHGLMSRVFLMKWYHWSVEYFEDLRNVNHCEFIIMKQHELTGKYMLQNTLRTWSELRRQKALEVAEQTGSAPAVVEMAAAPSPTAPKQWGGCPEGCTHEHDQRPPRPRRQTTKDSTGIYSSIATEPIPIGSGIAPTVTSAMRNGVAAAVNGGPRPAAEEDEEAFPRVSETSVTLSAELARDANARSPTPSPTPSSGPAPTSPVLQSADPSVHQDTSPHKPQGKPDLSALGFSERLRLASEARPLPSYLEAGRDWGGSRSGASTPNANASYGRASDRFDNTPHDAPVNPSDYGFPSVAAHKTHTRVASLLSSSHTPHDSDSPDAKSRVWAGRAYQDDVDDGAFTESQDKEHDEERGVRGSVY